MDEPIDIISLEKLTRAIMAGYREYKIGKTDASEMAYNILNFFGTNNDKIVDNILEPEDRDLFYSLEELNLVKTERELATLYDGREWRIHYWTLKKKEINNLAETPLEPPEQTEDEKIEKMYGEIPQDIFDRNY